MVLHSLSEILRRSPRPAQTKCKLLDDLMKCMQRVFPCKKCRDGIRMTWQRPSHNNCDVTGTMFWFHNLVSHKVNPTQPLQSIHDAKTKYAAKYERLVDTNAWKVYLVSFVYAVTTNCTKMCETLVTEHGNKALAHTNFKHRILNFMQVVTIIDPSVPPMRISDDPDCNKIFFCAYQWEKQVLKQNVFGSPNDARQRHLCARVNSKHYIQNVYPGNLCSKKSCHGACEKCDAKAIKLMNTSL